METFEIIKALRVCAETGCGNGKHCPYKTRTGMNESAGCYERLMHDAADRLEAVIRKPRYEEGEAEIHMRIDTGLLSIRDKLMFFDWSGMTQSEISRVLYTTPHCIHYHLKRLEEEGFHVNHARLKYENK